MFYAKCWERAKILVAGQWVMGNGYWVLAAGYWMLVASATVPTSKGSHGGLPYAIQIVEHDPKTKEKYSPPKGGIFEPKSNF